MMGRVLNIPSGEPFAKALCRWIIEKHAESPSDISDHIVILPTRRAYRLVHEAFEAHSKNSALFLPRVIALSDLTDLSVIGSTFGAGVLNAVRDIPPAIDPLQRQMMLANLTAQLPDFTYTFGQAFKLSAALAMLLDHIHTEHLDMRDLETLVPDDMAAHWGITLSFLKIISEAWPNILSEHTMIDPADHRHRMMMACSDYMAEHMAHRTITVAGTTGSIPATAQIMKTVYHMQNGSIILPGVDMHADDAYWDTLQEHHPQYGLKTILEKIEVARSDILDIGFDTNAVHRIQLASEMMRPAETSDAWQSNEFDVSQLQYCTLFEAETDQEEAMGIALIMRKALSESDETVVLITPDRTLSKRVKTILKRWHIECDDTAGTSLIESQMAQLIIAVMQCVIGNYQPLDIVALLNHPYCTFIDEDVVQNIDMELRGIPPFHDLDGFKSWINENGFANEMNSLIAVFYKIRADAYSIEECCDFINNVVNLLTNGAPHDTLQGGIDIQDCFHNVIVQSDCLGALSFADCKAVLLQIIKSVTVRPAFDRHPRLKILGQLEARMIEADTVIMGGLNESLWPQSSGHDPWMSRHMKQEFGLPSSDRQIGLAAHDFIQGFCAPKIFMTRSKKTGGKPTIPSRWLQQLKAYLAAKGQGTDILSMPDIHQWMVQMLNDDNPLKMIDRPAPCPPVLARPQRVSITEVETWIANPYALYAAHVLKVKPLTPLNEEPSHAVKGSIIHDAYERYVNDNASVGRFMHYADQARRNENIPDSVWQFWQARFEKIGAWVDETEMNHGATQSKTEVSGTIHYNNVTIKGRIDRIIVDGQHCTVVDYKSGGSYNEKDIKTGRKPQLGLSALMVYEGDLKNCNVPKIVSSVGYWILTGSDSTTKMIMHDNAESLIETTREGITHLITTYQNDATSYPSYPDTNRAPDYDDYRHLSRIDEWGVLGELDATGDAV